MAKSMKDNVAFLLGREAELPPTPLDVDHLFVGEERPVYGGAGLDLSGKPKILFLMGQQGAGKTTWARWVGERAEQRDSDTPPVLVSVDHVNRDLALYHRQTLQPKGSEPAFVVAYLEKLFSRLLELKRSAVIDFGGGDTAMLTLLAQTPGLHTMLEEGGVEPVALYFLSPRVNDLIPVAAMERAGFRPRATALMLNIGRTDPSKPVEEWFSNIRRQPEYKAVVERGAVEVWFPKLHAAVAVEQRKIGFWAATNNAGPNPLGIFDHRRVSDWLGQMDEAMQPIASWVDL